MLGFENNPLWLDAVFSAHQGSGKAPTVLDSGPVSGWPPYTGDTGQLPLGSLKPGGDSLTL